MTVAPLHLSHILVILCLGTWIGRWIGNRTSGPTAEAYRGLVIAVALAIMVGMDVTVAVLGGVAMAGGYRSVAA